jgi:hypothetical protein
MSEQAHLLAGTQSNLLSDRHACTLHSSPTSASASTCLLCNPHPPGLGAQVEQQLAEAMEQLQGLGADMEKKREVSRRVKKLRKDIADRVRCRMHFKMHIVCGGSVWNTMQLVSCW